jgi:hypothetical protein
MAEAYEGQYKNIYKQAFELAYFSKSACDIDCMMTKTPIEKQIMLEFINERLEIEMKKPPNQNY